MFNYATQFLLETLPNQPIEGVAEKLAYGGKMMLVGMGVVFSVLILLCLALMAFNLVFSKSSQKPAPATKKEPVQKVEVAPAPAAVASNEQEEIIAVIAAAIAAASAENPGAKFRVVSFKRK